ncbi:hypothetical protein EJD88_17290 [Pseudomonas sp. PB105]|uniref:hypothetical protein n=1 Tax=unclassified Pseudomonas TaxID=196821 RepID=UPI00131BC638|nr:MULTISPECIES: hypothetical protein [unclassified Pseudomonas]KAE9652211.1 hypothetical protein EJD88_17290 [Pseudomonas sp. PB105]MCM2364032.1 hypothetical protein [Pseudomonas sp. SR18]MVW98931.1 hypothetical protein [Pseudomonas sp. PB100]
MNQEYFAVGSFALLLLSFPIIFSAMYKKLDAAERYMKYSTFIVGCRHTFRHAHFEGRPQRVFAMATVILIPKIFQWRGMVLVEDVEKIPPRLKYWMVIPTLVTCLALIGIAITGMLIVD